MEKIYFAGSIRGGREDVALYLEIIDYLKKYGEVMTEHVGDKNWTWEGEAALIDKEIHDRDLAWLDAATVIIAEVTQTSLGVGYEIGRVVERNALALPQKRKRILCLYRPLPQKRLSAMIAGAEDVKIVTYHHVEQAKTEIDKFFKSNL